MPVVQLTGKSDDLHPGPGAAGRGDKKKDNSYQNLVLKNKKITKANSEFRMKFNERRARIVGFQVYTQNPEFIA